MKTSTSRLLAALAVASAYSIASQTVSNIYIDPFTSLPLSTDFQYDYSYNMHGVGGAVNSSYFDILPSPTNDGDALRVQIFKGDLLFSSSNSITVTCPRSEFSGSIAGVLPHPLVDNTPYVAQWYMYVSKYVPGYNFCFAQVHAPQPANLMLRFENGGYMLSATLNMHTLQYMTGPKAPIGAPTVSKDLHEDMNRWVSWRMEFILATNGTVTVYRDGSILGQVVGDTSGNGLQEFWKGGVYAQPNATGQCTDEDATAWFKGFQLVQGLPADIAHLPVLSSPNAAMPSSTASTASSSGSSATVPTGSQGGQALSGNTAAKLGSSGVIPSISLPLLILIGALMMVQSM